MTTIDILSKMCTFCCETYYREGLHSECFWHQGQRCWIIHVLPKQYSDSRQTWKLNSALLNILWDKKAALRKQWIQWQQKCKTSSLLRAPRAAWTEKCVALYTYILTYKEEKISVITKLSTLCCSVTKLCLTLCNTMNCSMSGFRVLHYLPEFAHTHAHWVGDAFQPSPPLSIPFSYVGNMLCTGLYYN